MGATILAFGLVAGGFGTAVLGQGLELGRLATTTEPLELAREVHRGDPAALIAALGEGNREEALGALRGAPWLDAPEEALLPIAALAAQDDPLLAPEAIAAALRIAQRLDPMVLGDREVFGELREAGEAFQAIAEDGALRRDLRQGAGFVAAALLGPSTGEDAQ